MGSAEIKSVTIAITTFNRLAFLKEALASALTLADKIQEVLVINDGSTDGTTEYLENLTVPKLRIIHLPQNSGRATARNTAISNLRSEYLIWLDDDDIVLPSIIETHFSVLEQNPGAQIIYGNLIQCREDLTPEKEFYYPEIANEQILFKLLFEDIFPQGGTLIHRSVFEIVGPYNIQKVRSEDYEYWARAASKGCVFAHNNNFIYLFRFHTNNLSNPLLTAGQSKFQCEIIEYIINNNPLEKIFFQLDWTSQPANAAASALITVARIFFNQGDDKRALECAQEAERFAPSFLVSAVKGLILRSMQDTAQATEELAKALINITPELQHMLVEIGKPRGSLAQLEAQTKPLAEK